MFRESRQPRTGDGAHLRAAAVVCCAVAALTGCGTAASPAGRLTVSESLPDEPVYVDGSISYLRITGPDDDVVRDGPATNGRDPRGRNPLFDRRLAPGAYTIVSYQRPCQGTCDVLDPPADRCEAEIEVREDENSAVVAELRPGGGCRITADASAE